MAEVRKHPAIAVLAANVRYERRRLGWSSRHLAGKAGLSASTACRLENGAETWLSQALRIADALGVPFADLLMARCPHCHGEPPAGFQCTNCKAVSE